MGPALRPLRGVSLQLTLSCLSSFPLRLLCMASVLLTLPSPGSCACVEPQGEGITLPTTALTLPKVTLYFLLRR